MKLSRKAPRRRVSWPRRSPLSTIVRRLRLRRSRISKDGSLSSGNSHDSHRLDTWRGVLKGGPVELGFAVYQFMDLHRVSRVCFGSTAARCVVLKEWFIDSSSTLLFLYSLLAFLL